jgi:hypothetical protein
VALLVYCYQTSVLNMYPLSVVPPIVILKCSFPYEITSLSLFLPFEKTSSLLYFISHGRFRYFCVGAKLTIFSAI